MVQLTKNFYLHEFDCKNGKKVPDKYIPNAHRLADNLQVLRDHLNAKEDNIREYVISVWSGYRSWLYNLKVGGKRKSKHLKALAGDIVVPGVSPDTVADIIEELIADGKMEQGGLGRYNTFTHYDPRGYKARWDMRK